MFPLVPSFYNNPVFFLLLFLFVGLFVFFCTSNQHNTLGNDYVVTRVDRCVQAVREIHSRPLSLWWLWPCPSVRTTCSMNFKSSAKCFTAILVPEVSLEIFLRERASEQRSGDIADNELRSGGAEREVFFSLLTVSERRSVHFWESALRTSIFKSWISWCATAVGIGSPAVFVEGR